MSFFFFMGSLLKMILITLIMGWTASCSEFMEEDLSTLMTPSTIYTNDEGLLTALAAVYMPMSYTWNSGYANTHTVGVLMGSDDLTTASYTARAEYREFDQYNVSDWNNGLRFIWNGAYKSIQGANYIIANYHNVSGDRATIEQIAGEAYFLRAYNYFWLVRLWGDVPLMLESHIYKEGDLMVLRSPTVETYAQIVEDLKQAEQLLGDKKPEPGRVGKGTAKSLLAEVYLSMTGWPIKDPSYYPLAAGKAKEVLDNLETYGFSLMEKFADLWPNDSVNNDGNEEEVFALNFWAGDWWNANALYGEAARPHEDGGWDIFFSEYTFFNEFPDGYRKEVTFLTELEDGTTWKEFTSKHPYFAKIRGPKPEWQNPVSLPLERLAEVYLVFAEAQVMATGNPANPDALEAVNKIVRRGAGLPPHEPNASVDLTYATQEKILQEKAWEFAGEYCRWFDLVRLEMVEEVIEKKHPDDLQPLYPVKYTFPIPKEDAEINPNLRY